jgi:hypothetical protein
MTQKVFSVKIETDKLAAIDILAGHRSTTRNAVVVEAIEAMLSGGIETVFKDRIDEVIKDILGFETYEDMKNYTGNQTCAILESLIDSRIKHLSGESGGAHPHKTIINSSTGGKEPVMPEKIDLALKTLNNELQEGESVALEYLADRLQVDKLSLAKMLALKGITTTRKRIAGARGQFYTKENLVAVRTALGW